MAWNEPGDGGDDNKRRNPWGSGNNDADKKGNDKPQPPSPWGNKERKGSGNGSQAPDLDEALEKLKKGVQGLWKRGSGNGGNGSNKKPRNPLMLPAGIICVGALVWAGSGFYQVDQGEQGVVLRFGEYHDTVAPGLHWNPPLMDKVSRVNTSAVLSYDQEASMLTADTNIVKLRVAVQYQVVDPRAYVLNVRAPEQSLRDALDANLRYIVGASGMQNVLTSTAEVNRIENVSKESPADVKASTENDAGDGDSTPLISMTPPVKNSMLSGREQLGPMVAKHLQQSLDKYGVGIRIQAVNLESASAPDQIQDAVDDVIRSREDRQRSINQAHAYENSLKPRTEGQAQSMIEEAYGYRDAVVAQAQGETSRFLALLGEYRHAPDVTRQRIYLDTLSNIYRDNPKVFVDTGKGNKSMMYLPLDQLRQQANGSSTQKHDAGASTKAAAQGSSGNDADQSASSNGNSSNANADTGSQGGQQ